ncbi:hypothetical protein BOTCAL_0030g00060 [Botryotinia calthae]|uniref:Uncharacterized protein n=1 Tax=Botryotinia calthae TaxID=38488 RepID=A0A4Y8DFP8_9HELO|nr:hypothetical protein BOTCAL_0030g00060 [Botryotinia calthae]
MEGTSEESTRLQTEIILRPEIDPLFPVTLSWSGRACSHANSPKTHLDPEHGNKWTICNHIASTRTSGIVAHGDQMTAGLLSASWANDTRNWSDLLQSSQCGICENRREKATMEKVRSTKRHERSEDVGRQLSISLSSSGAMLSIFNGMSRTGGWKNLGGNYKQPLPFEYGHR